MLSVVVIGKNEASRIKHTIFSLKKLKKTSNFPVECIYIDSASKDNTVDIAKSFFDKIYVLKKSPYLSASAGRRVGTTKAKFDWILYMDGDMELNKGFISFLSNNLQKLDCRIGYTGVVTDIYEDGSFLTNRMRHIDNDKKIDYFGGAVLLPRKKVLEAGNWESCLFSNEEIELYSRLEKNKLSVKFKDIDFIMHRTNKIGILSKLRNLFIPFGSIGKKFYGFGQLLRLKLHKKALLSFIKFYPWPFLWWSALLTSLLILTCISVAGGIGILTISLLVLSFKKGVRAPLVYTGLLSQALFGINKYNPSYIPVIEKEYTNNKS